MDDIDELCPICIEHKANFFTECNHCYCIECLPKILKCAICRKSLTNTQIYRKDNQTLIHYIEHNELNLQLQCVEKISTQI
jgi:hypothetical protein